MTDDTPDPLSQEEQIETEVEETFDHGIEEGNEDQPGYKAADAVLSPIKTVTFNLLLFFTRFAPFGNKFWKGFINAGYKGLVKSTSGAEGVGHIVEEGRIKHKPVAYKQAGGDGPVDDARWITNDGEWFKSPSSAKSTYLAAGRVPSIWASSKQNELGNHIAAETAEVLDMGDEEYVFSDATIQHNQITVEAKPGEGDAVADGGHGATTKHQTKEYVSTENPGSLRDVMVPLGTEADGRVVSMEKFYQVFGEHSDSEEMEEQHMMGRLAEKDPSGDRSFVIKVLLIAAGLVAIFVLGPPLVQALFGGGGGGGGSIVPLTLGLI